jgi:2-hydroxychromene-2-carboxylate isomerase
MKEIEFWFSIGSTYTYLSVTRLPQVARETGVSFSWQPFSVRSIMREMDNVPFPPSKQAKVDYMWRDIERRAEFHGLPKPKLPAPYPLQEFDRANHVGILLNSQGKYLEYFEETPTYGYIKDGVDLITSVSEMKILIEAIKKKS